MSNSAPNNRTRRKFLKQLIATAAVPVFYSGCSKSDGPEMDADAPKVLILGIDGMDYKRLTRLMAEGKMPNIARMSERGGFTKMLSSYPGQSPVAWSNFITGMNPGGHGIYDFIHRNPGTMAPYLSTSKTVPSAEMLKIGNWQFPLESGSVKLLRKGEAFWQTLEKKGIPSVIFRMPANFPPAETKMRTFSGMGTPDMHGSYGRFFFFTDNSERFEEEITGGDIIGVEPRDGMFEGKIIGPINSFKTDGPNTSAPFSCYLSQENKSARIDVAGTRIILKQGEWSDWVTLDFEMLPLLADASGVVRFYLKSIDPYLELYVTPININPASPDLPLSTPPEYSKELTDKFGPFYTQGMPEDTKALTWDVLNYDDFIEQAAFIDKEYKKIFWYELARFKSGVFFNYVSILDLSSHMFWHMADTRHPLYDSDLDAKYGDHIDNLYQRQDDFVGEVVSQLDDDTTVYIVSDHGFAPFYRSFNTNRWLHENGYLSTVNDKAPDEKSSIFSSVKWGKSRAYALGFNAIYLNVAGREKNGLPMTKKKKESLLLEMASRLKEERDPQSGELIFHGVYQAVEVYSGDQLEHAPDLLLGFRAGFRGSWQSAIGQFGKETVEDNLDRWGSDHCMDPHEIPGILVTNRKIDSTRDYHLYDMAPTILADYGVPPLSAMVGKPIKKV
jgi:predicted AlkP superfamily phosphohydrolase/phosphomutase